MKKQTLYLWIIAVLVLINAMQLGTHLLKPKPPHKKHYNFRAKAVEILDLNKKQQKDFYELAEKHGTEMDELNNQQKSFIKVYFNNPTESGLEVIQKIQSQKIEITQSHFNKVKFLLNPEQFPHFEIFKEEALQRILR